MAIDVSLREQMLASVDRLCRERIAPRAAEIDESDEFPRDLYAAAGDLGVFGLWIPEDYAGIGPDMVTPLLISERIARDSASFSLSFSNCGDAATPIVIAGSEAVKREYLPAIASGEFIPVFALTEPGAGSDAASIVTRAERDGDSYIINGRKMWTTTAQTASKILLIVRTTPIEECKKPTEGLTLFFTDLNRDQIEVRIIEKMGRKAVDSNALFIDDLVVPVADRIGQEGEGWKCLLHGLNPERILIAAEAVGLGQAALERAAIYAKERVVFDRPIGKNQAIQHPLAVNWMELEAAYLMVFKAASLYDQGKSCGAEANSAKYLAAEAAFSACQQAVRTHGGMGYAKEYHVERYLREIMIPVIAPVSQEMVKSFISEQVLGQEKSY